jgi:uncharacterized membrane protein YqgA involved in biofilm formation
MTGTVINIATILLGGGIGLFFGGRIPERARKTVISALGLFTLALGISLFLATENSLYVLGGLLIGGLLGEWWKIEEGLEALGSKLETRYLAKDKSRKGKGLFVKGFLTASLLFCVGPMTILGSIQDGLMGDYHLLAVKSVMDGFAALALASTLGAGVLFSIGVVFVYQGGITLMAAQSQSFLTEAMIAEMSAVGGILLVGLGISSLLEIRRIKVGNLLPALAVSPLLVGIVEFVTRG